MNKDIYSLDPKERERIVLSPLMASERAVTNKTKGKTKIKYNAKIFNLSDDSDRLEFEDVMSDLTNNPTKQYHLEETHFNRDGDYIVALRWFSEERDNVVADGKPDSKKP